MATLTISFSDEEMRRLEALGKRESLTVEQMVRLSVCEFIGQPYDAFHAAAKRVMEKNAEVSTNTDVWREWAGWLKVSRANKCHARR